MSTVGVAGIERLASLAEERGVAFVDAPVLGSRLPAEKGELVVLAAGPDEALERCAPVFDAVGSRTMRVGEAGAGTRLKLVVNHWILGIVEDVGETVALAQALDLDPGLWLEAIRGGAMDLPYAHQKAGAILAGDLAANFKLVLALKDARLVVEAAERAGMEAALARTIVERFERAVELGHGDEDMAATYFASAPKAGAR
jgi:3-hydroxyisobutyrate dehydrogenase